jgi:hypothetical protein
MPYCYYTCNLLPLALVARGGYTPRWLGDYLVDANTPARREALSIHPMICPYVTRLVAAADALFAGAPNGAGGSNTSNGSGASPGDCLVVPGGCDAARRMGDLLAATYPGRVFVLSMPRSSGPEVTKTLAADLRRLEDWLGARLPAGARPSEPTDTAGTPGRPTEGPERGPSVDYPAAPRPGGVFVVAGPLTDDSLLRLIGQLGAHVSGLESCTSPDRWRPLAADAADADHATLAARLLEIGMCPRRSTAERRDYLARRLDGARPSSIIYARQSFCDPGAYDALLVAQLAQERGLPYLEIEVDFPFDANGPLRTRVEAFLEAQLLDDDLLGDLDDEDLFSDNLFDDHPSGGGPGGRGADDVHGED